MAAIPPTPGIARAPSALLGISSAGRKRNGRILLRFRSKWPFVSVDRAPAVSSAHPLPALVFCPVRGEDDEHFVRTAVANADRAVLTG
jgi:hypothetical protein